MPETPARASPAHLSLAQVACLRGDRLLFEELDLVLEAGGAALVTGPNGAGKSSLLRIAAGLLAPAAGKVARTGGIALADERHALDPRLAVARALAFWNGIDGAPRDRSEAALAAMGIERLAEVPVRLLSTGQRRRAALARVIASGAGTWLLDEPASGLDMASLERLELAMARHRASGGIVVAATHQALALPDAVALALGNA